MMVPVLLLLLAAFVAADEPMTDLSVLEEFDSTSVSVVHCDYYNVCPDGTMCCLSPRGTWGCCPYPIGQCCRDGLHCCPQYYHCDATSTHCLSGWMKLLSSFKSASKVNKNIQPETVQCEGNVRCSADKFCCKTAAGQWGCCSGMEL